MARVIARNILKDKIDFESTLESFPIKDTIPDSLHSYGNIDPKVIKTALSQAKYGNLGRLYNLYEDMEASDARYGGLVSSLRATIVSMDLKVSPIQSSIPSEQELSEEYAALMNRQFELLRNSSELVEQFLSVYIMGMRLYEMRWEMSDLGYGKSAAFVKELKKVPNAMIAFDTDGDKYGKVYLKTKERHKVYLDEFHPRQFLLLKATGLHNDYYRMGIARKCLFFFAIKHLNQWWWNEYTERYGEPLRIAKVPNLMLEKDTNLVKKFLQELGHSGFGIFPEGVEVQLIEANRQGTITTYQDIISYADKAFEVALLGQVGTVGDQRQGSYKKAEIQNGIRLEILQSIARNIERSFYELGCHVLTANYGDKLQHHLMPKIAPVVVNTGDAEAFVASIRGLSEIGVPIPLEYVYEQMGIPMPRTGQHVLIFGEQAQYEDLHQFCVDNPKSPQQQAAKIAKDNARNQSKEDLSRGQEDKESDTGENVEKDSGSHE